MNLKQWRKKEGLKMHEAARRLGLSQPSISRIESGEQLPSSTTIERLVKASGGAIKGADLFRAWETAREQAA